MTALPIVSRELRIVARRPSTYWVRFAVALAACVVGGYAMFVTTRFNMGVVAKQILYSTVSSVAGVYALFSGIRNTSDNISIEKREGTLGLLFLTDLRGYDVVLGKLCSSSIHSLYGMMAAFPVLGVALIGGGITGAEFLRGSLALINVVFFAHSCGLLVSAYALNSRRALSAGVLIAFLFMWGLPIATAFLNYHHWQRTSVWISQLSPLTALHVGMSSMQMSPGVVLGGGLSSFLSIQFWPALLFSHLVGWIFLIIAALHVPWCWQNVDVKTTWRLRLQKFWHGSGEARDAFRRRLVSVNPFYWLASRTRFDPLFTIITLLVVGGLLLWFLLWIQSSVAPIAITIMVSLHLVLRVAIAAAASRNFAEQRRSGALEFLLACTPLDTKDLIRGQWLALRRQFLVPLILVLFIDGIFAAIVLMSDSGVRGSNDNLVQYCSFTLAMCIMLVADSITLGWVGMWMGVSANKANRASGSTVGRVMVWPCAAAMFLSSQIAPQLGMHQYTGYVVLGLWFGIGLFCDIAASVHARNSLHAKFRLLAATPYEEHSGVMAAIGRMLGKASRSRPHASRGEAPPIIG